MDFSVINDFPSKGSIPKVISIILAENGSLHQYPITKFLSSLDIKRAPFLIDFIDKDFGINQNDQLILRSEDGKQLESSMNLEDFFLKDKTIYVYGPRQNAVQEEFEIIGAISLEKKWSESCMQFLPSIYENFLGSNMRDYLDSEIVGTYDNLLLLFSDVKNDLNFLREGINRIGRQKDAENIAKKNLLNYNNEKKSHFDEVLGQQESKIAEFQQHIDKFDFYIDKLSKQEVDPQLGEENVRYLVDYFDMEKLKKSKNLAEKNQEKINQKSLEMKEEIEQYDKQLKNIQDVLIDHSDEIQNALQAQENLFADAQDMKLTLSDLKEFRNMIEHTKGNPSQIDLTNFVKKESETTIPKLKQIYESMKDIKEKLEAYFKENALKLKALVSDIKNIKMLIKGRIYNKLKVFCALVAKHEEGIFNIEILEKFPHVYQQSLNEIKRRLTFKKDYLTMLGILESFGSAENRHRHEFLEDYQHFLPKAFCPYLSKAFPHIRVSNIKRVVDQDLNLSFNDAAQSFIRPSSEADILKLLKNLNDNLETKDNKNKKLEEAIQSLKHENEDLKEQIREKVLNVNNFRKLLGSTGFMDQMDVFLNSKKTELSKKIDYMEKKVQGIQDNSITKLQNMISAMEKEYANREAEYIRKIKDLEQVSNDHKEKIRALNMSCQEKEKTVDTLNEKLETLTQKLEDIEKESIGLKEEIGLKEKEIARLIDQIKKYEKKEADSEQSKEKVVEELKKEIKEAQEEIKSKEKDMSKSNQTIAELNLEKKALTRQLQEARSLIEKTNGEKQELQEKMKLLGAEHERFHHIIGECSEAQKQKEKEVKVKEKEIELLKNSLEQMKKEKEKSVAEAKSALEEKSSLQDIFNKKIETSEILVSNKNEEIVRLKNIIEQKIIEMQDKEEDLSQKEAELMSLRHLIEDKQNDIDNLSRTIGADLNKTLLDPTRDMLSELGNEILDLYLKVFGKQQFEKIQIQENELSALLQDINKFICKSVAKLEDFVPGDKVVAVRLDEINFAVARKGMTEDNLLHIYKDEAKKFKDVNTIVGQIEKFGDFETDNILKKFDAVMPIKLVEVETLLAADLFKRAK